MKEEKKSSKKGLIILALIAIIGVTIGYAALTAQLNIDGSTKIKGNNWDIDIPADNFDTTDPNCTNTTTGVGCPINDDQEDTNIPDDDIIQKPTKEEGADGEVNVSWSVILRKPGDYYEFTVDAKNDGSINAKLQSVDIKGITAAQQAFANYTVTYSDGSTIAVNDPLNANSTKTIKVRVEFRSDVTNDNLPSSDVDLGDSTKKLTVAMKYVQA